MAMYTVVDKGQGLKELHISVPPEEQAKFLDQASNELSAKRPIAGFRPGKAPRDIVTKKYGAMAVLEQALDKIVSASYAQSLQESKLLAVGRPELRMTKVAPGEQLEYDATVAILPDIKLGDISQLRVSKEVPSVSDDDVAAVLADVRKSQASEVKVDRPAQLQDKVEIDFTVSLDNVVIDGGRGQKYPLILGDGMFIPGFEQAVVGMKSGESKVFSLPFPANYKKDLAGKTGEFSVKVLAVYERRLPELTDDFAAGLGAYKDVQALKDQVRQNLTQEKAEQADKKFEAELLDKLVAASTFSDIPELLVTNELHRMQHELEDSLQQQGVTLSQYLERLGKTREQLEADWRPAALRRVKSALAARQLAEEQKITASADEIEKEQEQYLQAYGDRPEVQENIKSADFTEYLYHTLTNRKVIQYLKQRVSK